MSSYTTLEVTTNGPVATIALNRPDYHNALTREMICELIDLFSRIGQHDDLRVVVLTGKGRSFCAGADLSMMRAAGEQSFEENVASSEAIFDLMIAVDKCPKPVIGRVNGSAIGGGAGLVSCCDLVVASERAKFAFSEVRLGLVPATISPFVLAKIGLSHGRVLFLTGERFDSFQAQRLGLVHHVAGQEELDKQVAKWIEKLLLAAPGAQAVVKELLRTVAYQPVESMREITARVIAQRRASDEGKEGMTSFLEKRRPNWQR